MGHLDSIAFVNDLLTASNTILEVESTDMYFDSFAETQYNYLTANVSWSVGIHPSWVTVTPNSGSGSANLNITVEDNSGGDRIGSVTISGGGKSVTINITQYGNI